MYTIDVRSHYIVAVYIGYSYYICTLNIYIYIKCLGIYIARSTNRQRADISLAASLAINTAVTGNAYNNNKIQ